MSSKKLIDPAALEEHFEGSRLIVEAHRKQVGNMKGVVVRISSGMGTHMVNLELYDNAQHDAAVKAVEALVAAIVN